VVQAARGAIRQQLAALAVYRRCLGRERSLLARARLVVGGRGALVRATAGDRELWLRLGTTDFAVFDDVYGSAAYDWPLACAPHTIVDAGAYTGISTVWFAQRFPDATIIAVEPHPDNFEMLLRNVRGIERVVPVNAGLWGGTETLWLENFDSRELGRGRRTGPLHDAGRLHALDGEQPTGSAPVRGVTVQQLMAQHGTQDIDLLKVDIEGAEVEVFSNPAPWIDHVQAVCIELHDRFRPGCTGAFLAAVEAFPERIERGEYLLVARDRTLTPATTPGGPPTSR